MSVKVTPPATNPPHPYPGPHSYPGPNQYPGEGRGPSPAPRARKSQPSNVDRALAAYPAGLPIWVRLLAAACDRTSQQAVGERLGRSGGYVSRLLNNCYPGDIVAAEQLVRSVYSADEVACPLWGPIPLASCMTARRRKGPPRSQMQRQHARHCPTCPLNGDLFLQEPTP